MSLHGPLGGELPRTKNIFKRVREVFKNALKACCWYLLTFFKSIVFVVIAGEWLLCRYCPLIPRRVMRGQGRRAVVEIRGGVHP